STDAAPNVRNEEVDYGVPASWTTFPERLEDNGISWKVYQNELSVGVGFAGEEDAWLANFTDNPLEFFSQYRPQFSAAHYARLKEMIAQQEAAIREEKVAVALEEKKELLAKLKEEAEKWSPEKYAALSQREKNLHEKAFTTNRNDPDYHQLSTLNYDDDGKTRTVKVPKGDILHQFREDVKNKQLPTVSWLVAPENFSDHPGAPWYGAWYISEVLDILTQDPEVWKKTIFILAYDENDGDFDHVPPFVPPHGKDNGLVSEGIDTSVEYVTMEQEMRKKGMKEENARESPIGLGYRVPLVVASPWSRGGYVNSEVFDHTSVLQFLEHFLTHKTGKKIVESNISQWRRTICGDLTSVFRPYNGEKLDAPAPVERDAFIETIHKAQFKKVPAGFKQLTPEEIAVINRNPADAPHMAKQEEGVRPACALPYELYVDGKKDNGAFRIKFTAGKEMAGQRAVGAPFHVYYGFENKVRAYAVAAGDSLTDEWSIDGAGQYQFKVYGPNGFFREFKGYKNDPQIEVKCEYERRGQRFTGNVSLLLENHHTASQHIVIKDNAYNTGSKTVVLGPGARKTVELDLKSSYGWYDLSVEVNGDKEFVRRYAGHVETGAGSFSDPLMGGLTRKGE
ncbi:MAG TPA: alkaline phosphatase family protein, partial [Chitinophaga sp.]|nr:alkaline phosphatase family protein [Chitinophaga sp.]